MGAIQKLALTLVLALVSCGAALAGELLGNCVKQAKEIQPSAMAYAVTLQREWSPEMPRYDEATGIIVNGDWLDKEESDTYGMGVYYFKVTVQKGRNYLLWTESGTDCFISIQKLSGVSRRKFDSVMTPDTHTLYHFIRSEDWDVSDDDSCTYIVCLRTNSERGKTKNLYFKEQAITDIVNNPGSRLTPRELDMTTAGSVTVVKPTDAHPYSSGSGLLVTYYRCKLKKGVATTLTLKATTALPSDYRNFADIIPDETVSLAFVEPSPGWVEEKRTYQRTIVVDRDVSMLFYVYAYDPDNTTFSWGTSVPCGKFAGTLTDQNGSQLQATFKIEASVLAGQTNFTGTVTVNGTSYPVSGVNGEITGSLTVGAKTYPWQCDVQVKGPSVMQVDGTVWANVGDAAKELVVAGLLDEGTYTIRFDANGGSGSPMPDLICEWGKVYRLRDCTFAPPDQWKRFAGWTCRSTDGGEARRYDPGMLIFNLKGGESRVLKFSAVWAEK